MCVCVCARACPIAQCVCKWKWRYNTETKFHNLPRKYNILKLLHFLISEEIFSHDRFRLEKRLNFKFNKRYVELQHYGGLAPTNFRIADRRRQWAVSFYDLAFELPQYSVLKRKQSLTRKYYGISKPFIFIHSNQGFLLSY